MAPLHEENPRSTPVLQGGPCLREIPWRWFLFESPDAKCPVTVPGAYKHPQFVGRLSKCHGPFGIRTAERVTHANRALKPSGNLVIAAKLRERPGRALTFQIEGSEADAQQPDGDELNDAYGGISIGNYAFDTRRADSMTSIRDVGNRSIPYVESELAEQRLENSSRYDSVREQTREY